MTGKHPGVVCSMVLASVAIAIAQGPAPEVRQRIDAFVAALATGDPARFEAMAQEQFAPEMLARRTPADRRSMVATLRGELGGITLERVERNGDASVILVLRGSTGLQAHVEVTFEADPPGRIAALAVKISDGDRPGGPADTEPPPDIRGSMSAADIATGL